MSNETKHPRRSGTVLVAAGSLLCVLHASRVASAYTASCSSGICQVNFTNGHSQKVQPLTPVGGQPSLTCTTDADCDVLVHPACPSFPICNDASDTRCVTTYQTVPGDNGTCTLTQDVIIPQTLILPSFVHLDCANHAIIPQTSVTGDCCPSNGLSCSSSSSCGTSTPELAIFLNGAYGVTVENCSIGASGNGDAPFDFGVLSMNNKSDPSLAGDRANLDVLQNRIINNPAIHTRFLAVNLAFSDNMLIDNNLSITATQRGGTVIFAWMSSQANTISHNTLTVGVDADKPFFTGAKRFPGPVATSNTVFSCGHGVNFAQFVGDNATCSGTIGKNSSLANALVNGQFYQQGLSNDFKISPATQGNTLGPGNQISIGGGSTTKGGTFGLKTTAPDTTIVQNTFSGAILAVGVAANGGGPAVPGTCAGGGARCLGGDDCSNALGQTIACVPSGTIAPGAGATGVKIDGNQIFVPDYPSINTSTGTAFASAMNVSPTGATITNNQVTLQGSLQQSTNITQGLVFGAGALETPTATAAIVTGNSISRVTNALFLNDVDSATLGATFGATIILNDFTSTGLGIRLSSPFSIPIEFSKACRGNFWGLTSVPAYNSSLVGGSPLVVDSHPYTFSVATASNPPIADTQPPFMACPSSAPTFECNTPVSPSHIIVTDDCDSSPTISETPASFGASTITWTSTDHSNNSATLTCPAAVIDTIPPSISCPASITAECDSPSRTASLASGGASGADSCSAVIISDPIQTLTLPVGSTTASGTVTHTATDQSGLSANCQNNVTLTDTTPPSITCPADPPPVDCANSARTATIASGNATGADACGPVTLSDPSPVVVLPVGSTTASATVTHTATDQSDLTSSCQNTVTLQDLTPPAFDAASLAAQTVVGNCQGDLVALMVPTAADACSTATTVSCAPLAGSSFGANTVTCTASDMSGNQTSATLQVQVLEPLRVDVQSPLHSVPNDNLVKDGSTVPSKIKLYNCRNVDVTRTAAVTAKIGVTLTSGSTASSTDVPTDFHGVGDPGGTMVLVEDGCDNWVYQFNLSTKGFTVTNHTSNRYMESLSAAYSSNPGIIAGAASVILDTK